MKMTTGAEILTYINARDEYKFLREDPHLGNNIILLGLGGSHAYGMNKEGSDIDIRGIALNSKDEILLGDDFAFHDWYFDRGIKVHWNLRIQCNHYTKYITSRK